MQSHHFFVSKHWEIGLIVLLLLFAGQTTVAQTGQDATAKPAEKVFKLGIIGTTTSHVPAFVGLLNDPKREGLFRQFEVVGAYPGGMPDNPGSWGRVEIYSKQLVEKGIALYSTIEEMLPLVDGVLLESVDGRCHLQQAIPVIMAGKPLFIDKPMAASLADVIALFNLAETKKVPIFSSSSLRYSDGVQAIRTDLTLGDILGAIAWSPSTRNPTHSALFWYGIHGVETLYTIMGTGCESVACTGTDEFDMAVGVWKNGRIGTFRGDRKGRGGYGGTVFGSKKTVDAGNYAGYKPLVEQICQFFLDGKSPIDANETIEIMAFMEAAEESLRQDGKRVKIAEIMERAKNERQLLLTVRIAADQSLALGDKKVELDDLAKEIDSHGKPGTRIRIILTAAPGYAPDLLEKVCKNLGTGMLANFVYQLK